MTSWSDFPSELILAVSKSLTLISDYVRLRSVCSSWRSALPPLHPPFLLFPSPSTAPPPPYYTLLSFPTSKTLRLYLPSPLLGSSDGFLLLRHFLLSPLAKTLTSLPSLKTFPYSPFFIKKLILSPSSSSSILVALLSPSSHLARCRPDTPSSSWSLLSSPSNFHDALFFASQFHLVDAFRRVFTLSNDDNDTHALSQIARVRIRRSPPFIGKGEKCYLVEWRGSLMLVVRMMETGKRNNAAAVTTGFEVFRFDAIWGYEEVKSLEDVVVFLGLNASMAMEAEECPGFRGNCVYFLDDALNCHGDGRQTVGDSGVFDFGNGSVEPLRCLVDEFGLVRDRRPAVWFTPSLC